MRLIDGLQTQGWVERIDDTDRRVKRIQLTSAGRAQVEAVKKVVAQMRTEVMQEVPEELLDPMQAALNTMLDRMAALESEEPSDEN